MTAPRDMRRFIDPSTGLLVPVAAFVAVYLSWQVFEWTPWPQELVGSLLGLTMTIVAAGASWRAARRASHSPRLRRAWRLVALAIAAQAAGTVAQLVYEVVLDGLAYPSIADALFLSFYPLLLAGILAFPAEPRSRRESVELALDCAIVSLGGAAVFVFFILGPDAIASSTVLEAATSIAYPAGDGILLVGLGAALMRQPVPEVRATLRLMAVALGLFIVADLLYGYIVVNGIYAGGDPVDTLYVLAFACFAIAASRQNVAPGKPVASTPLRRYAVNAAPYLAVTACLGTLVATHHDEPLFPQLSVAMIAVLVTGLVVARQLLALTGAQHSSDRLDEAQRLAEVGSWEWNIKQGRLEYSAEMLRLFGIDARTAADSPEAFLAAVHPDDRERVAQTIEAALTDAKPFAFETRIVRPDGRQRTLLARGDVELRSGRAVRVHGTHQDITDRKAMEHRLHYQAEHDPVTGLYNRRRFGEEVDRVLRSASLYGRTGALLIVDIDNFKVVNDSQGHAKGDTVLKGLADTISDEAGGADVIGRLGGDEFGILLPEKSEAEAIAAAEDLRQALAASAIQPPIEVSIGLAVFDGAHKLVADDLLAVADIALYRAKEDGKNQVQIYDPGRAGPLTWAQRIAEALAEKRFVLYGQPILNLHSGEVAYHELLIRMISRSGEVISPGAFMPTAERLGLIGRIDRWVVREGLEIAAGGRRVSINLSAKSIGDPEVLRSVREALGRGVEPADLIFEITETAAMTNLSAARDFAANLTELGCHVALDDFGTGFASFSYLKHLPARYVKIDMEFVRDMLASRTDQQVVKSITEVAHTLGKQTIAEGVEDGETLEMLRRFGVDCAQGFHVGRPAPLKAGSAPRSAMPVARHPSPAP